MATPKRVYWLDWLKVLGVLGIFYYHSALVFAYAPWLLSNSDRSILLSLLAGFGFTFGMPLMFLLAGGAAWFGLRERTAGHFLSERLRRLLVPMLAGIILLSPFQAYLAGLAHRSAVGSLPAFYVKFLGDVQAFASPLWFGRYGYHLWFLGFLFSFSALSLPLLAYLRSPAGRRPIEWLVGFVEKRGGLYWLALVPGATQVLLRARYHAYQDWSDFAFWLAFFVLGFVFLSDQRFVRAIDRSGRGLLFAAVVSTLALGPLALAGWVSGWEAHPDYSPGYLAYQLIRSAETWFWVLAVLVLGIRVLDRGGPVLTYANEAVLPFYVIHHPVIVLIAFYVIQWPAGLWVKHVFLTLSALLATMAIYELGIRRVPASRWVFGMKPLPAVPASASQKAGRKPLIGARPAT